MSWLRPVGRPKAGRCPGCAGPLKSGLLPLKRHTDRQYRFSYCEGCRAAWTSEDPGTDYRLSKVGGKWRATPI